MEKQTTIYSYPDMAMCGTSSQPIEVNQALYFTYDGWYISDIFDSGHLGMNWDRLCIFAEFQSIHVEVWADDKRERLLSLEATAKHPVVQSSFPHVVLKPVYGQYLRFRLSLQGNKNICLRGYEIIYPYRSHVELLPQMYQEHEDLHLFMAPFDDAFLILQREIRQLPRMWNPIVATQEQVLMMASFLNLDMLLHVDIDILRTLLIQHHKWMHRHGTVESLFFLASVLLKRNVVLSTKDSHIHMIGVYHDEEEAQYVEALLNSQIAFGVGLHITWLVDAQMDNSYTDIGLCYDLMAESAMDQVSMEDRVWM